MTWWRRRAQQERDMQDELESLAHLVRENGEPNALGNLTRTGRYGYEQASSTGDERGAAAAVGAALLLK